MSIAEKLVTIAENEQKVYEAGQKTECDRFWDNFQNYGGEVNYYYAFAYGKYNDENFNPKYPLNCLQSATASSQRMFYGAVNITDIKVPIYASQGSINQIFYGCTGLVTIPLIRVHETTVLSQAFENCTSLVNVAFEGVIGQDVSFKNSPLLSDESLDNIIEHLKDLTSATAKTITFHTDIVAKLTDEQMSKILAKNWLIG